MRFSELHKTPLDLLAAHIFDSMEMICLTPIYRQPAQGRDGFFSIDGSRKLFTAFGTLRQLAQSFDLTQQGHAIPALPVFSELCYQFSHMREQGRVQKFMRLDSGSRFGVTRQPGACGVRVSSINVVSSEFSLPVCQRTAVRFLNLIRFSVQDFPHGHLRF